MTPHILTRSIVLIGSVSIGAVVTLHWWVNFIRRGENSSNKSATREQTEGRGDGNSRGFEQWVGETATQQGHSRENGVAATSFYSTGVVLGDTIDTIHTECIVSMAILYSLVPFFISTFL